MPLKAMKGHAHKGCWTCPRLLTRVFLSSGQRKTRERKEKEGREGTPDLGRESALAGKGVYPRSAGPHVLARATRPASTFHGDSAGSKVVLWALVCSQLGMGSGKGPRKPSR